MAMMGNIMIKKIILLSALSFAVNADMLDDYNSEIVTYIELDKKIYPEFTHFTCVDEKLHKKHYGLVTDHMGNAVKCKNINITRKEYEKRSSI